MKSQISYLQLFAAMGNGQTNTFHGGAPAAGHEDVHDFLLQFCISILLQFVFQLPLQLYTLPD